MALIGRRIRTGLLAALAVALLSGPALAAPSPASVAPVSSGMRSGSTDAGRATFGIEPASATGPDRRPYLTYDVTPGGVLDDHVAVVNYSRRSLTLSVYATDALNDDHGGFALLDAAQRPTDAGTWLAVGTPGAQGVVTVPEKSRAVLPLHLRVPGNASPGDHVAGVVVALSTLSRVNGGVNVKLDQRVAVRVYVRVSGPVHPRLVVERIHTAYVNRWSPWWAGSARVTYQVRNAGNVKLGGRPTVRITGLLGSSSTAGRLPDIPLLLPGAHVDLVVTLPHVVPEIWETTSISVQPLVLPGDADPGLNKAESHSHFLAVPWVLVAILLLGLALLRWMRRRRRREPAGTDPARDGSETKVAL